VNQLEPGNESFRASSLFFFGLALSVAWLPYAIDPAMPVRWAVAAVFAPLILMSRGMPRPLDGWGLVCLFCLGVGVAWNPFPSAGLEELAHLLILGCVFCVGASGSMTGFWRGTALGMVVSVVLAIAQLHGWEGVEQYAVPAGLFANKNTFAEAGLVVMAAGLGMGKILIVLVGAAAVVLGKSKAALGASFLIMAVVLRPRAPRIAKCIVAAVVMVGIGYFLANAPSSAARVYLWALTISNLTPMGHGLGSFINAFPVFEHVHNEFLQVAFENGYLGLSLAALLAYLWRPLSDEPEQLVLTSILAVSILAFPLRMPFTACAFALSLGCAARRRALVRSRERAAAGPGGGRDCAGLGTAGDARAA